MRWLAAACWLAAAPALAQHDGDYGLVENNQPVGTATGALKLHGYQMCTNSTDNACWADGTTALGACWTYTDDVAIVPGNYVIFDKSNLAAMGVASSGNLEIFGPGNSPYKITLIPGSGNQYLSLAANAIECHGSDTGSQACAINAGGQANNPFYFQPSATTAGDLVQVTNSTSGTPFSASSGTQNVLSLTEVVNQSSTAGYNGLLVAMTETTTGSGTKNLIKATVGAVTECSVDDAGNEALNGGLTVGASSAVIFSGRSQIQSTADGYVVLENNAGTGFTGLRLGGTTASFPMWKLSGTEMQARTASDSAAVDVRDANTHSGNFLFTGTGGNLYMGVSTQATWAASSSGDAGTPDTGLERTAAGTVCATAGSTGCGGKIQIGSTGTPIIAVPSGTASLDFGATAAGACDQLTVNVTGAADGDPVALGIPSALFASDTADNFDAAVSSAGVVTVERCCDKLAGNCSNPAAATVRVDLIRH